MTIGDRRRAACPACNNEIEWTLRQRIVGPEGMRDATAIWQAPEHGYPAEVGHGDVDLCAPVMEPVYGSVEGAWTDKQRTLVREGRGFDPTLDPVYVPADQITWREPHVSCVMPTTVDRLWCLERSIACWRKQSWPHRTLLIVSDGVGRAELADAIAHASGGDPDILHVHLDGERRVVGQKYNDGIALATSSLIALWADDDWHHPNRLEVVVRAMQRERVGVGGTNTMLAYRDADKRAFMYWSPGERPYLIGGTMIFSKDLWRKSGGFPIMRRGSDSEFVRTLLWGTGVPWCSVNDPRLYVAFVHGANTGNPLGDAEVDPAKMYAFVQLEGVEADMRRHLGADAAAFGF